MPSQIIGKLTNLFDISLQNNTLSGTIPTALTSQLDALTVLRLGHNALRGCVPRDLSLKCSDDGTLDCYSSNSPAQDPGDIFDQACGRLWVCEEEEENEACAAFAAPHSADSVP